MKFLKIENNQAFFLRDKKQPEQWSKIDEIEKEDLLNLLDYATDESFEVDPYDEALLANKAHQIIYKSVYEKFIAFISNKDRFKDEVENEYKEALNKYK